MTKKKVASERKLPKGRHHHWCFTSYLEKIEPKNYTYCVYGHEICPDTGQKHLQGYIEFYESIEAKAAQKRIGDKGCHIGIRVHTSSQAANYCKKGEGTVGQPNFGLNADFVEDGVCSVPEPGKRNDLKIIRETILSQEHSIRDLLYKGTINNNQQLCFAERLVKYAKPMLRPKTKVFWHHAKNTDKIFENLYNSSEPAIIENTYLAEPSCRWFDGYVGQPNVIFHNYNGGNKINIDTLIQITGSHPLLLPCKGSFVNWKPTEIHIISNKYIHEIYHEECSLDDIALCCKNFTLLEESHLEAHPENHPEVGLVILRDEESISP